MDMDNKEELQDLIIECFLGRISPYKVAEEIGYKGDEAKDTIWNILMKWKQKEIDAKHEVAKQNARFLWFPKETTAEQYEYMSAPLYDAVDEIWSMYRNGIDYNS